MERQTMKTKNIRAVALAFTIGGYVLFVCPLFLYGFHDAKGQAVYAVAVSLFVIGFLMRGVAERKDDEERSERERRLEEVRDVCLEIAQITERWFLDATKHIPSNLPPGHIGAIMQSEISKELAGLIDRKHELWDRYACDYRGGKHSTFEMLMRIEARIRNRDVREKP